MFTRQSVTLTSRLVSLYFFFSAGITFVSFLGIVLQSWPAGSAVYQPSRVIAVQHGVAGLQFIEVVVEVLVGIVFFKAGPAAVRFLFADTLEEPVKTSSEN